MADEAKTRRKAMVQRLKARRCGKEAEFQKREAGEAELQDADASLTHLEELEFEARGNTNQTQ